MMVVSVVEDTCGDAHLDIRVFFQFDFYWLSCINLLTFPWVVIIKKNRRLLLHLCYFILPHVRISLLICLFSSAHFMLFFWLVKIHHLVKWNIPIAPPKVHSIKWQGVLLGVLQHALLLERKMVVTLFMLHDSVKY